MSWSNTSYWKNSTPALNNTAKNYYQKLTVNRFEATEILQRHSDNTSNPLVPPGTITLFATVDTPKGYLPCDGSEVSRADYPSLFATIGTRFGAGDNSTTFNLPLIPGVTANTETVYKQGNENDKDCSSTSCDELLGDYAPNNTFVADSDFSCMKWSDWGDDIFDGFGNFYVFNPATNEYNFFILDINQMNGNDRDIYSEQFSAFGETFEVTYGYLTRGVFRMQIRCIYNYSFPFIFGCYGDMGSDESTINTNQQSTIDSNYTLYYNRNVESGDSTERFFTYIIPMNMSEYVNEKPYYDYIYSDDRLSIYTKPMTWGVNVYFSKTNDVRQVVKADLRFGEGDITGGGITYDGDNVPIISEDGGVVSPYVIKF